MDTQAVKVCYVAARRLWGCAVRAKDILTYILLLGGALVGCGVDDTGHEPVLLFAAASTAGPIREVIAEWNTAHNVHVDASYASSSTLAQQITHGAPADLFLSANTMWVEHLEERGALVENSQVPLMGGQLVLIAPNTSSEDIFDGWSTLPEKLNGGRLAIGDTSHVPLGVYGREALTSVGIWDSVASHVTNAHNARVALAQVERGEAPLGIAYATDAAASDRVRVVARFPPGSHAPVTYTLSLSATTQHTHAKAIYDHLLSEPSRATYARHRFVVAP